VTVKTELRELEQGMDSAESYQGWLEAAQAHDELTGMSEWREEEASANFAKRKTGRVCCIPSTREYTATWAAWAKVFCTGRQKRAQKL